MHTTRGFVILRKCCWACSLVAAYRHAWRLKFVGVLRSYSPTSTQAKVSARRATENC